ncbi:MAG TPA: TonB family protein [Woeseiaceae bacterium]|nr:TonB family protein [Woeseiaceae bacterium]
MLARYASAVSTGTLMTFALLYVMQLLITLQPGADSDIKPPIATTWLPVKIRDTPVQPEPPKIVKEELVKSVDTPKRPDQSASSQTIAVPRLTTLNPPKDGGIVLGAPSDGALVNIVRVSPVYPARALAMGLEGHVVVQFDVDAAGRVMNAEAIESSHSIFEKEAVRAAERFRYKARVVDGVPMTTRGIRNIFTFEIND